MLLLYSGCFILEPDGGPDLVKPETVKLPPEADHACFRVPYLNPGSVWELECNNDHVS